MSGPVPSAPPELSVLIATHGRRELLRRCLQALCSQDAAPTSFEVVVADDGSADGSAAMAAALETPYRLRVLALDRVGQPRALNAALAAAAGELGLILDDDVIAAPSLVSAHLSALRERPRTIGVGKIVQVPPARSDWFAHAHAKAWNRHFEEFAGREPTWLDCYGANLSAPLEALREVGGMDERLVVTLDLDLARRLCDAGCVPRYLERAECAHDDQKSGAKMLAGSARTGASRVELARRLPALEDELLPWSSGGPRELQLRRALIALRVPAAPLAAPGRLIPGEERQLLWYSVARRYAFWRGAREAMSRAEWARVTGRSRAPLESSA